MRGARDGYGKVLRAVCQLGWWLAVFGGSPVSGAADVSLDLGTAKVRVGAAEGAQVEFADGARWPAGNQPAFVLEGGGTHYPAKSVAYSGKRLVVGFGNGARAEFEVTCARGFALFQLRGLAGAQPITSFRLFLLPVPAEARVSGTLNGATFGGHFAAVMAAKPNVHGFNQAGGSTHVDRAGCSHELVPSTPGRVGGWAARFTAKSDSRTGGWSMAGRSFPEMLDLTGCRAIRAWVYGDGQGEALKIQLYDGAGGYRDNYVTIDFQGWRQVTLTNCPINTLRYDRVHTLNLYYNGLPANTTVTCLVDQIEAQIEREGETRTVLLEDFEDPSSSLWSRPTVNLCVQTYQSHGLEPAVFGVLACPEAEVLQVVQRFEAAAGLPHPAPGGVWNKESPRVKRSYLFLTNFREGQLDEALALARRGGFDTVLLGQESWSQGTGHYEINRQRFPEGLEGLKRTLQRFKEAGFHVGLHFLAASIYPPDTYLTPVPDTRLVKGAAATLAADVTATTNWLPVTAAPEAFPAEDGGYNGQGTILQVGAELIQYAAKAPGPAWGFSGCRRGHLGTRATAHREGETVRHLVRAYGYHLYDLDTSLAEEVAEHFARVADACRLDMVYFDGSERLQGEHWYYNARLHQGFYDKLANKDILLQASSYSHYSWHLLARSASADGHGDLKGYLDQRSGHFTGLAFDHMPLDIGWYYGYDPALTPDMFEYVLAATVGYDSSMSYQVSCEAAAAQPFTGEILDLIARYERLRLSGKVPEAVKRQLRIDPAMTAIQPGNAQPELLAKRREYRLLEAKGKPFFQRVVYEPWHEVKGGDTNTATWQVRVSEGPCRLGVQLHGLAGAQVVDPVVEVAGRRWTWKGTLAEGQFLFFWPGKPVTLYGPRAKKVESTSAPDWVQGPGEYTVRFGSREPISGSVRLRLTREAPERLEF